MLKVGKIKKKTRNMKIINIQNLYRERKAFLRQVTVAESEIP
jgi:hypothetical protein